MMSKKQIIYHIANGRIFWHYVTKHEQAIFASNDPKDFGDCIAIFPIGTIKGTFPIKI